MRTRIVVELTEPLLGVSVSAVWKVLPLSSRLAGVPLQTPEMSRLLKDENPSVRKAAAKAVGKLASRMKQKDPQVVEALREASNDKDPEVRMKVQKAVRLIGA